MTSRISALLLGGTLCFSGATSAVLGGDVIYDRCCALIFYGCTPLESCTNQAGENERPGGLPPASYKSYEDRDREVVFSECIDKPQSTHQLCSNKFEACVVRDFYYDVHCGGIITWWFGIDDAPTCGGKTCPESD